MSMACVGRKEDRGREGGREREREMFSKVSVPVHLL